MLTLWTTKGKHAVSVEKKIVKVGVRHMQHVETYLIKNPGNTES